MLKCILLCGIPASGKSTWAKSEVENDPTYVRICRDDLRNMLYNYKFSNSNEKLINCIKENIIIKSLQSNRNIIIDECHAQPKYFNETVEIVQKANVDCQVVEKSFYEPLQVCLERNAQRSGTAKVSEEVIHKFWKKLGKEQHQFYHPRIEIVTKIHQQSLEQNINLPRAYVVDLDGTVADIRHRSSPYATDECLNDLPFLHVIETVLNLYKNDYKIIFVSGREDKYRDLSEQWLNTNLQINHQPIIYDLYMRKTQDMRKDQTIKKEIYQNYIQNKYYVVGVFDDRPRVTRMFRNELGLTVFSMNEAEF